MKRVWSKRRNLSVNVTSRGTSANRQRVPPEFHFRFRFHPKLLFSQDPAVHLDLAAVHPINKSPQNHRIPGTLLVGPLNVKIKMLQNPQAKHHIVIKTLKKDLLKWTPERHAGDYPLDRRLLRDGIVELAAEHQVTGMYLDKFSLALPKRDSLSMKKPPVQIGLIREEALCFRSTNNKKNIAFKG